MSFRVQPDGSIETDTAAEAVEISRLMAPEFCAVCAGNEATRLAFTDATTGKPQDPLPLAANAPVTDWDPTTGRWFYICRCGGSSGDVAGDVASVACVKCARVNARPEVADPLVAKAPVRQCVGCSQVLAPDAKIGLYGTGDAVVCAQCVADAELRVTRDIPPAWLGQIMPGESVFDSAARKELARLGLGASSIADSIAKHASKVFAEAQETAQKAVDAAMPVGATPADLDKYVEENPPTRVPSAADALQFFVRATAGKPACGDLRKVTVRYMHEGRGAAVVETQTATIVCDGAAGHVGHHEGAVPSGFMESGYRYLWTVTKPDPERVPHEPSWRCAEGCCPDCDPNLYGSFYAYPVDTP